MKKYKKILDKVNTVTETLIHIMVLLICIATLGFIFSITAKAAETWYVGCDGLNLRAAATTDSETITVYPHGTELSVIGTDGGDWWEVWDGTLQGWCNSRYLVSDPNETPSGGGTYLGTFKITHYCPNSCCNGGYGNNTAWAGEIIPGQTIAVDPSIIPKLSRVYIDGYGVRIAEDCGGGIRGNHIDVAMATHAEAMAKGVVYRDVYLAE